jgi:hypothetical protein
MFHWHFIDISSTFHRHFIDISSTFHRHFIDISLTFHLHFIDISLMFHWHFIDISLTFHWYFIDISSTLYWHFIDISLTFHWHFIDISLTFHWYFIDISSTFYWHFIDISLTFHWHFIKRWPCTLKIDPGSPFWIQFQHFKSNFNSISCSISPVFFCPYEAKLAGAILGFAPHRLRDTSYTPILINFPLLLSLLLLPQWTHLCWARCSAAETLPGAGAPLPPPLQMSSRDSDTPP